MTQLSLCLFQSSGFFVRFIIRRVSSFSKHARYLSFSFEFSYKEYGMAVEFFGKTRFILTFIPRANAFSPLQCSKDPRIYSKNGRRIFFGGEAVC